MYKLFQFFPIFIHEMCFQKNMLIYFLLSQQPAITFFLVECKWHLKGIYRKSSRHHCACDVRLKRRSRNLGLSNANLVQDYIEFVNQILSSIT